MNNILHLKNIQDVNNFINNYTFRSRYLFYCIQWKLIYKNYNGLLISPFNYNYKKENYTHLWLETWDCSSGCIWNLNNNTIVDFQFIEELKDINNYEQ